MSEQETDNFYSNSFKKLVNNDTLIEFTISVVFSIQYVWDNFSPSIIAPEKIVKGKQLSYDIDLSTLGEGIDSDELNFNWTSSDNLNIINPTSKSTDIIWTDDG